MASCRRSRILITVGVTVVLPIVGAPASAAPAPAERVDVIVELHDPADTDDVTAEEARNGAEIRHRYGQVLTGFAAAVPTGRLEGLRRDPRVAAITLDDIAGLAVTQSNPPWGLDRIDQRSTTGDGRYLYDTTGTGVSVYVVDTGVRTSHVELRGRAVNGVDLTGGNGTDCNGHGTHVAGTVAGTTYGVAKGARIVSVRVFGGCGGWAPWSTIIAGLDWVVAHRSGPSVANLSVAGSAYTPMDDAVARATVLGVHVVVAAGNDGLDACTMSPARAPSAITVAAIDRASARPAWSNWGSCVDVFAPGDAVLSSLSTSDTASTTMSGTSMAAPHVAGAAARLLQPKPATPPSTLANTIVTTATADVVTAAKSAKDNLVHVAPPRPDLVVTSVAGAPTSPSPGTGVRFTATVKNQGSVATPAGTVLGVAFKVEGTTVTWSNTSTASLAPGSSVTLTANAGGSSGLWTATSGTHAVVAQADSGNLIVEGNETNNARSTTLTVGAGAASPDLVITAVTWSPTAPVKGTGVRFGATVKNQGTAPTPSGTLVAVLFQVNGTTVTWSTTRTASIPAGTSVTLWANTGGASGVWTPTTAGSYTVRAHVDAANRIAESVETNNVRSRTLTVGS